MKMKKRQKRKCRICGKIFVPNSNHNTKYCNKKCTKTGNQQKDNMYHRKHKVKINKKRVRYRLKYLYDITLEQYDKMFEEQNGVCAICSQPEFNRRLSVDHNHKTNEIRGLLCTGCNVRLGTLEDKEFLEKITKYLEKYNPKKLT